MKLAEALVERKAAQVKLEQLRQRLERSVVVQEGEEPLENPTELLEQLEQTARQLEGLIVAINHTNSHVVLESGVTIMATIAKRDMIMKRISILDSVLYAFNNLQYRVRGSEIKLIPAVNVSEIQKTRDMLSKQHRDIDTQLQLANWTTDLILP